MSEMRSDDITDPAVSIRLVSIPGRDNAWAVAFRNDGLATLRDVTFYVTEGGIPSQLDLGSTIVRPRHLDTFGPFDEFRMGSVQFVRGGEYSDLPLSASICLGEQVLSTLIVTTEDFDRLEELRGNTASSFHGVFLAAMLFESRKRLTEATHPESKQSMDGTK